MRIFTPCIDQKGKATGEITGQFINSTLFIPQIEDYMTMQNTSCVPKRFLDADLNNFCANIHQSILDGIPYYVSGSVGTGKTHLLCGTIRFYNAVQAFGYYRLFVPPIRGCMVSRSLKQRLFMHHTDIDSLEFEVESVAHIPQLFIDDLGTGRNTEFTHARLERLLDIRYNEDLPLWFSTNLGEEELMNYVGARIYRRIKAISNGFILS